MKVAIANDHAAVAMKEEIERYLYDKKIEIINLGTDIPKSVDYPEYAKKLCELVKKGEVDFGILICGTGIGMSIAANKIKGIRAALVSDTTSARLTRLHNDANVLCMGARIIGIEKAKDIVDTFLNTKFSGEERHMKRIKMIED